MRYLAVFALIFAACGEYDGNEFSEPVVCFEDGTKGKISAVQPPSEDPNSPLGPAETLAPNAKDARLQCTVTKYWDLSAGPGCIYYDCQNCTQEDFLKQRDGIFCGHTFCPPSANGWVNQGDPGPGEAAGERAVH